MPSPESWGHMTKDNSTEQCKVQTELLHKLQFILITLGGQVSELFLETFLRFPRYVSVYLFLKHLLYCATCSQHWLIYIPMCFLFRLSQVQLSWKRFRWAAGQSHMQRSYSEQGRAQPQEGHRGQADYLLQLSNQKAQLGYPSSQELLTFNCSSHSLLVSRGLSGPQVNSSVPCFTTTVRPKEKEL